MGGWRTEDRPQHLYARHKNYQIVTSGIGAPNHLWPDMQIGLQLGWGGILNKIRRCCAFNRPADPDFYAGEEDLFAMFDTTLEYGKYDES